MLCRRLGCLSLLAALALPWQPSTSAAFPAPKGPERAALYQQIAALRQRWTDGHLQTSVNEADVQLCQSWLDLLEDEGCIHPSGITGTPLEMFDAMTTATQQLAAHAPELGATVNTLVGRLDRLCNLWYADGTPGDVSDRWVTPRQWTVKTRDAHEVVLSPAEATPTPFDLTITAFADGVYRIHGPTEGFFKPATLPPAGLTVHQDADQLTIDSSVGTLQVSLNPLHLSIVRGKDVLWEQSAMSMLRPTGTEAKGVAATRQQAVLTNADHCFGLGERFDTFDHLGRVVSNWTSDSIFSSVRSKWTETYKPIPLVIDPRGVSTFFNTQTLARIDCGATDPKLLSFVAPGPVLDEYLFVGSPMAALHSYTKLTGRPLDVPGWALEPWMGGGVGRWNIQGADHSCEQVREAVERMHQLDIPHSAIYIEGLPTDKPEGKALVSWLLNEQHLRPLAWYGPVAAPGETDAFTADQLQHLFVREPGGQPFIVPPGRFLAGDYYIDFTDPLSVEMLNRKWKWHLDEGIRGCMIDGGEEAPRDGVFADALPGDVMHNLYPLFYHKAHQALFRELLDNDYILFGRSGAPGDQASMGQFPGDMPGDFSGLTGAIHAGLTASASGFSVWGSDVGGYWSRDGKPPSKSTYLRWYQFATFSPLTRVHGEKSPREPWNWDQETVDIYKHFAWLKENLHPYLVETASHGHAVGEPMMRPLPLLYPHDPTALASDDEYLFGPDLLVAPLHSLANTRDVYLPAGQWYDLFNDLQPIDGGATLHADTPLSKMPVYVRGGAILPLHLNGQWALGESMTPGSEPVTLLAPDPRGAEASAHGLTMHRDGSDLMVSAASDEMLALWIPAATSHAVTVGEQSLAAATALPPPGPVGTSYFDAEHHRLCARTRILPGTVLRVSGYFTDATAAVGG